MQMFITNPTKLWFVYTMIPPCSLQCLWQTPCNYKRNYF